MYDAGTKEILMETRDGFTKEVNHSIHKSKSNQSNASNHTYCQVILSRLNMNDIVKQDKILCDTLKIKKKDEHTNLQSLSSDRNKRNFLKKDSPIVDSTTSANCVEHGISMFSRIIIVI